MHARTRLVLAFVAARAGPRTVRGRSNEGTTVTATTTTGTSGAGALTAPICRPGAPPCIALGSLVASRSTAFTSAGLAEGARSRAAWSRWRCSFRRTMRRAASDASYRHTSAIARGSRSRFSFRRSRLFPRCSTFRVAATTSATSTLGNTASASAAGGCGRSSCRSCLGQSVGRSVGERETERQRERERERASERERERERGSNLM